MITDERLRAAAARSCEIYVSRLEQGYDPENQHEYSSEFERKIKKLKRKANHPILYRTMQRVASIILAILISGTAFLTVNTEARAAFFGWVKEVYETYFVYRFEDVRNAQSGPTDYRPAWLPEGYSEFYTNEADDTTTVIYANESGQMLKYNYISSPNETDWYINAVHVTIENVTVNGYPAQMLISNDPETASAILWTADDNTAFYISGFLSSDELIKIAESSKRIK